MINEDNKLIWEAYILNEIIDKEYEEFINNALAANRYIQLTLLKNVFLNAKLDVMDVIKKDTKEIIIDGNREITENELSIVITEFEKNNIDFILHDKEEIVFSHRVKKAFNSFINLISDRHEELSAIRNEKVSLLKRLDVTDYGFKNAFEVIELVYNIIRKPKNYLQRN